VVVVTINHRLGLSGLTDFSRVLGGEYADSSNLSIRDMIAALEWVRDNIAAFGGNADLVTIFGESGGGWKVSTLLGIPSAKGLFHRAIIQSGPLTRFLTPEQADAVANAVLAELGVTPDTADKLCDITFEEVVAAQARMQANTPMSMRTPGFPTGFWPVIDGEIIPAHVFDPDAAPSSLDVPLLIGQNGTEFTLFMLGDQAAYSLDNAGLERRVAGTFGQGAVPDLFGLCHGYAEFADHGCPLGARRSPSLRLSFRLANADPRRTALFAAYD
jgi:para-nitrobenzyl esterase